MNRTKSCLLTEAKLDGNETKKDVTIKASEHAQQRKHYIFMEKKSPLIIKKSGDGTHVVKEEHITLAAKPGSN